MVLNYADSIALKTKILELEQQQSEDGKVYLYEVDNLILNFISDMAEIYCKECHQIFYCEYIASKYNETILQCPKCKISYHVDGSFVFYGDD